MTRGDTHSRLVGWLKLALPLAALVILSTLFLIADRIDPEAAIPYANVDVEDLARDPRMTTPSYAGLTSDGSALTLTADVQRIEYSGVKSVGNAIGQLFAGNAFGSGDGPGFGWKDVTVVKLGVSYDIADWTLRAGYSHASQPVPKGQTLLNILAPGVVQDHVSLGATWRQGKAGELSVAYTHAFRTTLRGSGSIPPGAPQDGGFGGGEADVHLAEDILGVAWGWKF